MPRNKKKSNPETIFEDHRIYENVFAFSVKLLCILVLIIPFSQQVYSILNKDNVFSSFLADSLFSLFKNALTNTAETKAILTSAIEIILLIVSLVVEIILSFIGYEYIFNVVMSHHEKKWYIDNPGRNFAGTWLHIHEKENIRIGKVEIQQNFNTLKVNGFNIDPVVDSSSSRREPASPARNKTSWVYIDSEINPQRMNGVVLSGSYVANKSDGRTINQGVHNFTSKSPERDSPPTFMSGFFCDCIELGGSARAPAVIDLNDRCGSIYFYRLTPKMKEFLDQNSAEDYNLQHILELAKKPEYSHIAQEAFVVKLQEIANRHKQRKDLIDKLKNLISGYTYVHTSSVTYADNEVSIVIKANSTHTGKLSDTAHKIVHDIQNNLNIATPVKVTVVRENKASAQS